MFLKALSWILILAAGAALALWWGRDSEPVRALQGVVRSAGGGPGPSPGPSLHKCVRGSQVTYTDQPCAAGAHERPLDGAVTVLPAARPAAAGPASGASSPLRRWAGSEQAPDLQQRRIDEAVPR